MIEAINKIITNNSLAHPSEKDDYTKDGILYCGKCNTPKQIKLSNVPPFLPPTFKPFQDCACEKARKEKEAREHKEALFQLRIQENTRKCFQNDAQRKCTFSNDDGKNPELMKLAKSYCEKYKEIRQLDTQRGLLLFGSPGGGKSYVACSICNELLKQGYACKIATIPELTNDLQCSYDKNEYLEDLCDIDLLVLDDFGVQRNTSTANEYLFEIINKLLLERVPVIITTNMSSEELKNPGDINLLRITSRLFELCFPFEVKFLDRRKTNLKENYGKIKTLLES